MRLYTYFESKKIRANEVKHLRKSLHEHWRERVRRSQVRKQPVQHCETKPLRKISREEEVMPYTKNRSVVSLALMFAVVGVESGNVHNE